MMSLCDDLYLFYLQLLNRQAFQMLKEWLDILGNELICFLAES